MFEQHALYGAIAAIFCICMALFSLLQGRSKGHLLFAAYNVSNALWNCGDVLYWFDGGSGNYEWLLRLTGIGGCFLAPFYVHFCKHVAGIADQKNHRLGQAALYAGGLIFSILHQTPLLHTTALSGSSDLSGYWSRPGPLYSIFMLFVLVAPLIVLAPLPALLRQTRGVKRQQIIYLIFACALGFVAVGFFAMSFISFDWPWAYYGVQSLVSVVFAYTIFQHNLIHLSVALRRSALACALYLLAGLVAALVVSTQYERVMSHFPLERGTLIAAFVVLSTLFSLPPIIYGAMVKRSSLFQDQAGWQITHEFKTPLAAIQSATALLQSEMAKDQTMTAKAKDYAEMIHRNSSRLEGFVEQLLTLGTAEKNLDTEKHPVDVRQLAQEAIDQFPSEAQRIRLESPAAVMVTAIPEGLRQVFSNLLSNAVKHAPSGTIHVVLNPRENLLQVSVKDHGDGIAKENLTEIFLPFVRTMSSRSQRKGSGLGLTIARQWVEAHGGKIWAESEGLGMGATISFSLPMKD